MRIPRPTGVLLSVCLLAGGGLLIADHELGSTGRPSGLGTAIPPSVAAAEQPRPGAASTTSAPGVPVRLEVPFPSSSHPEGVTATISAHPLNGDGSLFVPDDPRELGWYGQAAAPGDESGSVIVTGHVNFVVDGRLVVGALSDLAEYGLHDVGKTLTVDLADGRRMTYRIVGGSEYSKDELAARPELRRSLFDQDASYGDPPSGRLVLVSCGGAFDDRTGNYEDNVFVFALPVT